MVKVSAATLTQYHRLARVRVALNNSLMSMHLWGLMAGLNFRVPPSTMVFCTSSLVYCSWTMRERGDLVRQEVLNKVTDALYQFCGCPLEVELWPPQCCKGHMMM